jgi:hypothetical protein
MHQLHQVARTIARQGAQGRWFHDQDATLALGCTTPTTPLIASQPGT